MCFWNMTTISHKSKKSAPRAAIAIAALLILAAVIWRGTAANIFWKAAEPILRLRDSLDKTENARLRAALASSSAALSDRNFLYQENLDLKSRLGRAPTGKANNRVLAGVLQSPPGVPYDTLLIDAGARQGIKKGDFVSAGGETLIGAISDAYDDTARVVLFSAPGETYQAIISSQGKGIPVSIHGQGAGSMTGEIPESAQVAVGDSVVFPGISGGFTGAVSFVRIKNGESFKTIYVRLPVDLFSLQYVEVWKK